ncbi:MAG: amidohydrolase [Actinomycetota bacterium]|nr:MAG: amidohydrolase [Actinomycetota bacterium]
MTTMDATTTADTATGGPASSGGTARTGTGIQVAGRTGAAVESDLADRRGLVDADLHIHTVHGFKDIYPYLPTAWRRRFELKRADTSMNPSTLKIKHPTDNAIRVDAAAYPGAMPASDPEFTKTDYLERYHVDFAVATSLEAAAFAVALAGPDEAAVLCSGFNDYFLEHWCEYDSRYRYALCVSVQDPIQAAAEIRRVGGHRGVAAVYMPLQNILIGNRHHYPIYEAAQEQGLPILLHLSGTEGAYQGSVEACGGIVENYSERRAGYGIIGWSNLNNLTFSTTFQRFPELRFAFIEFGFSWLMAALWRLDTTWQQLRIEVPWLTEPPTELLLRHVRFGTQPIDEPRVASDLYTLLSMMGTDWLMFTTDYPHWDGDEPETVLRRLAGDQLRQVMRANGEWMFRLS